MMDYELRLQKERDKWKRLAESRLKRWRAAETRATKLLNKNHELMDTIWLLHSHKDELVVRIRVLLAEL